MTTEQAFFISVLADFMNKRETARPSSDIDWKAVISYAQIHQVGGILHKQCKEFVPSDFEESLAANFASTMFYYANRTAMVSELKSEFEAQDIPCFTIKGDVVAKYYPVPALRTMGDTDIVIHREDRLRAHEIFLAQGYTNQSHFEDREWIYYKNRMEFELHDHLVYSETINRSEHEVYFNDFWKHVHDGELDCNFHILFLLLHLRKHLMNSGVGFRMFMDIALMARHESSLDWEWIESELDKLNMLEFARKVFALNAAWFGFESPIKVETLSDEFYETATEQIFRNGIFGFNNEENRDNAAVNIAREGAKGAMFLSGVRAVFPSYKRLITIPRYSFLRGKPLLLPAAWIYRIARGICVGHFSRGMKVLNATYTSKDRIEKRSNMLEQWGL